jgi:hypothetical protein
VFDPADDQVLTEVAAAGSADGARPLDAAVKRVGVLAGGCRL